MGVGQGFWDAQCEVERGATKDNPGAAGSGHVRGSFFYFLHPFQIGGFKREQCHFRG